MSRPFWPLAAVAAAGVVAALFVREGVYRSHAVADGVVVVNRFTGAAFRVRNGLREPVEPSTLENRIAAHFERLAASPEAAPVPVDVSSAVLSALQPDDDPFAGMRHNPDFKVLSPEVQFDRMKRYADYWLQPSQSARLPRSDRGVVLDRMLRGLLAHPHAKTLPDADREELKQYYRGLVEGRN